MFLLLVVSLSSNCSDPTASWDWSPARHQGVERVSSGDPGFLRQPPGEGAAYCQHPAVRVCSLIFTGMCDFFVLFMPLR